MDLAIRGCITDGEELANTAGSFWAKAVLYRISVAINYYEMIHV